jgi:DNA mismatch repair protein MutL
MKRPPVLRLPEHVANQIAAGEVVARPASVVKELVENALDAGATTITVAIEAGGVTLVRIVDDGHGMSREDATAALERHATSKLRTPEDLLALRTLGFRGEAIPSIASVSRFRLRTRTSDDDEGTGLASEGDGCLDVRPCGCPVGTVVEVRDLFFNVPARRKFLRAVATESAHVGDVVREAALAHPEVQLELWRDGRLSRSWLRATSREARVRDALGEAPLACAKERRGPLAVEAYLGGTERTTNGATGLTFLVNQRPVQDRALARAVAAAYGERLERGKYPLGVVYLDLPAESCDVNVHPQKAEVRFAEPRAVNDALRSVIASELARVLPTPSPASSSFEHASEHRGSTASPRGLWARKESADRHALAGEPESVWTWSGTTASDQALTQVNDLPRTPAPIAPSSYAAPSSLAAPAARLAPSARGGMALGRGTLRYLSEIGGAIVAATALGVVFVDRRAALARVTTARALAALALGPLAPRRLVFPLRLEVPPDSVAAHEAHAADLERLGFELRASGPRTLVVHAVAEVWSRASAEALTRDALARAASLGTDEGRLAFARAVAAALTDDGAIGPASGDALLAAWLDALDEKDPRDSADVRAFVPASAYEAERRSP